MLPRHQRIRVLDALEDRVRQFRTREAIYPLRTPRDPLLLDDLIRRALPEAPAAIDPASLKSRSLLTLGWGDAVWTAWVITLPSAVKLFCDSNAGEARVLASGGRNAGDESDRLFLTLLAESGGAHFGVEMGSEAPETVRSAFDRPFLVGIFVDMFEGTEAEESVRSAAAAAPAGSSIEREMAAADGRDFAVEVRRWLELAMR